MTTLDPSVASVYTEHGCAMGEAQLLEQYLGHLIIAATDPPTGGFSPADYDALVAENGRMSIGRLIDRLASRTPIPDDFGKRLRDARDRRNWLVHRYFADRAGEFQTQEGRQRMVRELDELGEQFYQLWGQLDEVICRWFAERDGSAASLARLLKEANSTRA